MSTCCIIQTLLFGPRNCGQIVGRTCEALRCRREDSNLQHMASETTDSSVGLRRQIARTIARGRGGRSRTDVAWRMNLAANSRSSPHELLDEELLPRAGAAGRIRTGTT